ncbi:MAG: hypothetical protein MSQ05_02635 [Akkermansia sp.]|nr:hypothetical protein [Akkermansia sp.]
MRLHLPKGLLAALLAACFALPAGAAITTTPLTSLEVEGVTLPTGTYKQVTTTNKDSMTTLEEAAATLLKSNGSGEDNQRFKVTSADTVSNAGTLVIAQASVDGSLASGGQLYLARWITSGYLSSALEITNNLIIGQSAMTNVIRLSDSTADASKGGTITISGDITLAQNAQIGVDKTCGANSAFISGSISGEGKTLSVVRSNGDAAGYLNLGTGSEGKTLKLGGLSVSGTNVTMNYASATVGNLTLSGTAFTNSGSLTIGGEGKTLTLGTVLGGKGTVEIKDSTTVNVSESLLRSVGIRDFSATENGFATISRADISSIISGGLTLGNGITWKSGTTDLIKTAGVLSGFGTLTTTEYHVVNASVTWTEAADATSLFVADNLTVEGGSEVPTTVGTFNIGAGSTLSMNSLSGTKTVNGEGKLSVSSLSGEVTINGTANVAVGTLSDSTTISGSAHIDITGNINRSGKSLTLKNNADGAMVTLYGTNDLQMIDLKSDGITAHMTLAAGSTTTLSASRDQTHGLWMHTASTLDILKEERDGSGNLIKSGGKLSFGSGTAGATISATDQDASISATNGAHYAFNSTDFTLTKAEFRANASAGDITLSNKLDKAIVVNDSSNVLTVNNAANTLRGVEAKGGNIKFAANAEVTGSIKIADGKSVVVNSGAALTHDAFTYDGSTITTSNAGSALSLWNNAVVSGGTLTQKENSRDGYKEIGATLTNVKLVNAGGHETWLTAQSDTLSGMKIDGTLRVGQDDRTFSDETQKLEGTFKKANVTVSGAATVTALKVDTESTLELAGQDTNSSITTLTGSGALKASGDTKVTNASGFSGSLESGAGATLNIEGGFGVKKLAALKSDGGAIWAKTGDASVTSVSISEVVLAGGMVGVYSAQNVEATVQTGSLTVSGSSMLYADLELTQGGTLTLNSSLTMGSTLTLNSGITLSGSLLTGWADHSQALTLFTGVDSLTLVSGATATTAEVGKTYDASSVFANEGMGNYKLQMVGTDGDYTVQMVQNAPTPEPTTATLSLLALMGLAARRRRKA